MNSDNIYKYVIIGDVCSVGDGAHSKVKRIDQGVPYLTSKNIGQGSLKLDKFDYISEESFEKLFPQNSKATRRPKAGDVLFGIIGTFGNAYLFKEDDHFGFSSSIGILRPGKVKLSSEFLYYVISSNSFKNNHANHNAGSVQGYTNIPTVKGLTIPLPPLETQKKIALILSSLDNKITLNNQINQTLEQMAQALFKSWFVDFDPVKAKMTVREGGGTAEQANLSAMQVISGKTEAQLEVMKTQQHKQYEELKATAELFPDTMQESELGDIPSEWKVKSLGDLTQVITKGSTPRKSDILNAIDETTICFIKVKDISNSGEINRSSLGLIPQSVHQGVLKRSVLKEDDLLFSIAGTIGRVAVVDADLGDSNTNQAIGIIRLSEKSKHLGLVWNMLQSNRVQNDINSKLVQGVQANASLTNLKDILVIIPSDSLLSNWNIATGKMIKESRNRKAESRNLTQLRDTLLPKLISGELAPSKLDKMEGLSD